MYNADWIVEELERAKVMIGHTEWRIKGMAKELKKAVKSGASSSAIKGHEKWLGELEVEKNDHVLKVERLEELLKIVDLYNKQGGSNG